MLAAGAVLGWLAGSGLLAAAFAQDTKPAEPTPKPSPDFKGVIKLDIRDSKPDWTPFTPKPAPKGAPNVLVVL
jgi:arylsulfatase